ncbi:MAG: hypothetical protein ABS76_11150 [Pelagibacterium sp. SCN 64-44]|nr:MAG: hypothetical protein ABS76_11150 [Pelagibacterium sp. SCN 64-44]
MNIISRRTFMKAGAAGLAGMAALGMPHIAHAQGRTLRLSHHLAPDHLVDVASKRFGALVAEKTGGAINVEVFPAGQLAGLRQGAEAAQIGTVDFVWTDFGTLANWIKPMGFISLPFLFRDEAHALAVFKSDVGADLGAEMRDTLNLEALGYGIAGFRVMATRDRAINEPGDLAGLKVRVPEVPVYVSAFNKLGANPTPMAWAEVYTALQTGVIDGVENPAEGLVVGKIQEVTGYAARTNHIMTDVNLVASAMAMDGLGEDEKTAVREAAAIAVDEFNTTSIENGGKFWDDLAAALDANAEPNRDAFREALLPVWDEMDAAASGGMKPWIERVQAIS